MTKRDKIKSFIDENYFKPLMKNDPTKIIYIHIDELWSTGLADMIDY